MLRPPLGRTHNAFKCVAVWCLPRCSHAASNCTAPLHLGLNSALIFFYPGTNSQVLIAALMCVLFLFLVSTNKPYRDEGDDRTNSVAYVCLVFTLLLGMALKVQQYEASDTAKQDQAMYTALLIIVNVTLVLFALWQMIMDAWAKAKAKAEKAKMAGNTIKSRLSRAENDVALANEQS